MRRREIQALDLLCLCLGAGAADSEAVREVLLEARDIWPGVLAEANRHYLGPALWVALEALGLCDALPQDVREFLEESARLNHQRNQAIKAQCVELVAALERSGIRPIVLKGAAQLFLQGDAMRTRMMVDLDILVPDGTMERAATVAADLGYRVIHAHEDWHHDYHILGRGPTEASLEFHRTVGQQRQIIPVAAAYKDADRLRDAGVDIFMLSPTDRVLHNVFHAAIQDRSHHLGLTPLRALHDLGLIRKQSGDAIDWARVQRTMHDAGYGGPLLAFLYLAQELLGQRLPAGLKPTAAARRHLLRCRLLRRLRILRGAMEVWATVTHPFARAHFEYLYGQAPNGLALQWGRLKLAGRILIKHRHKLMAKLLTEYRKLYRSS